MKHVLVGTILIVILLAAVVGGCVCGSTGGQSDIGPGGAAGQGNASASPGASGTAGSGTAAGQGGTGGGTGSAGELRLLQKQMKVTVPAVGSYSYEIRNAIGIQGEALLLSVPEGAVSQNTSITAEVPASPAAGYVAGTAIQFGPDGLKFLKPVNLTIHYRPADVPANTAESSLRLCKLMDGKWQTVAGSTVDTAAHKVTGQINGFSTYAVAPGGSGKGILNTNVTVSIDPILIDCTAGGQATLRAVLKNSPPQGQFQYSWRIYDSGIINVGKYGRLVDTSSPDTAIYVANKDAQDGASEKVKVVIEGTEYLDSLGGYMSYSEAYATITIRKSKVSIEFPVSHLLNDVIDHSIDFGAKVDNPPSGPLSYEWTTTGRYGGLVNGNFKEFTTDQPYTGYQSNGRGQDGEIDQVYVSVYQVQGTSKRLIGNASGRIEIYKPTNQLTIYMRSSASGGSSTGDGSPSWRFYIKSIDDLWEGKTVYNYNVPTGGSFFARPSDVLVMVCDGKGYGNYDVMIKKGPYDSTGDGRTLIFANDIQDGLNRSYEVSGIIERFTNWYDS